MMILIFLTNRYLIDEPPYVIDGAPLSYGPGFFRLGGLTNRPDAARWAGIVDFFTPVVFIQNFNP